MKARSLVSRIALGIVATLVLATTGVVGLSYYDVRATTGPMPLKLVSIRPNPTHILVLRWRMGERTELDLPGQYVLWTVRPFRRVHWLK